MRDYVLFQSERIETGQPFAVLRRLFSNWRKRQRLRDLQELDDHVLKDNGVSRGDVIAVLSQPVTVDPVRELERRTRLRRTQALAPARRQATSHRGRPRLQVAACSGSSRS